MRKKTSAWAAPALTVSLCVIGTVSQAEAQSLLSTNGNVLAYSGGVVPGPSGLIYSYVFDLPLVADDGTVFFRTTLDGGDVTGNANNRALFLGKTAADVTMLARSSDPAPGLDGLFLVKPDGTDGIQTGYRFSPDGRTFWSSYLSGPGVAATNDSAMFGGPAGSQSFFFREGDVAPGTGGAVFSGNTFTSTQFSAINRSGAVMFQSNLAGSGVTFSNNQALFAGDPAALAVVVRRGDTVLPGVTASTFTTSQFSLDTSGRVLYNVNLGGAGVNSGNDASLWVYTPGSGSTLLVREGQIAPGTAGATFNNDANTWQPSVSVNGFNGGWYEFTAVLQGGDAIPGVNDFALYAGTTSGSLTLVARNGDPAPGTDAVFDGFLNEGSFVNSSGAILTVVNLRGGTTNASNNMAVYVATPTGIPAAPYAWSLVVRAGDPAPGAPGDIFGPSFYQQMAFNDSGQAIFNLSLIGPDVIEAYNTTGMWGWDRTKGVFMLARSGDLVEVSPGYFLTASTFGYVANGNTDGSASGLSKNGIFAMNVPWFESGSSVVTVDLNCYPPTSAYPDADGDGFGDPNGVPVSVCANAQPPAGYVANNTDCNDADPAINPLASDANCDGIDNNCNGSIDEGYAPVPTTCGVGACLRTGATACQGGTVVNSCVPGTPSVEVCNGIDDNCDGQIDNGIAPPGGLTTLTMIKNPDGSAVLHWGALAAAQTYDTIRGNLGTLQSCAGDFSVSTDACVDNDDSATTTADNAVPMSDVGFWYLVRGSNCGGAGTYNDPPGSRSASRDAGIAASPNACP